MKEALSQAIQRWETEGGAPQRDSQQGPSHFASQNQQDPAGPNATEEMLRFFSSIAMAKFE
jgi:hypothetical protein